VTAADRAYLERLYSGEVEIGPPPGPRHGPELLAGIGAILVLVIILMLGTRVEIRVGRGRAHVELNAET
jgi:hypothetical protein